MTTNLCNHLIEDAHLEQPFALLAGDDGAAYLCPACLADEVHRRIETESPAELGADISFSRCDHDQQRGRCLWCEVGSTSSISLLWSRLKFSDPNTANRLGKLLKILGQRYNRSTVRAIDQDDPGQEPSAPVQTVYTQRMLRSETLNGDRARSAVRWSEGRVQRKRTLRAPKNAIVVVPPPSQAAVA
jgi:hypothetical protein